jgi:hypothetical protein
MRKAILAIVSLLLLATGHSFAQKDLRVGTNMLADDNIFRNYAGQSDVVFIPYASLGYGVQAWDFDNLYFGYNGEFYLFNQLSHRDFSVHQLGADYNHTWPESQTLLALGGQVETRFNPENYSYYNYTSGGFYANFKRYLKENVMFLARYNLNGKRFNEFPEFNYAEQVLALQTNIYLPTRTTLSVSSTYYHKNYTSSVESLDSTFVNGDDLSQRGPFPRMGRGMGMGRMFWDWQDPSDPSVAEGFYIYGVRQEQFASTDQLNLGATVAQNLAEGTGLMFGYFARVNPHNRNRFLANLGESVLNNEELFDDHYSYIGHDGKLQLKQLLPGESTLTLLLSARSRKFSGRPAMDLEGNILPGGTSRLDRAVLFQAQFTKRITNGSFEMLNDFNFSVNAGAGKNSSNDEYYDYKSAWFSVAVEKAF